MDVRCTELGSLVATRSIKSARPAAAYSPMLAALGIAA